MENLTWDEIKQLLEKKGVAFEESTQDTYSLYAYLDDQNKENPNLKIVIKDDGIILADMEGKTVSTYSVDPETAINAFVTEKKLHFSKSTP